MRIAVARPSLWCAALLAIAPSPMSAAPPAPGSPQTLAFGEHKIDWRGATRGTPKGNEVPVFLQTNRGQIPGRYHPAPAGSSRKNQGVIWVSGAGGGLDGPARALYPEACERLQAMGIAGLRLDYRKPQDLHGCVLDTLCGVAFFASEGISRVVLVGHSFGGGVVIAAGASSPRVRAVVPMASQTFAGLQMAPYVAPRAMLLIHGTRDKVLPVSNARKIYEAAGQPKELKLFEDAGHGLGHARQEILDLLLQWIPRQLGRSG